MIHFLMERILVVVDDIFDFSDVIKRSTVFVTLRKRASHSVLRKYFITVLAT